MTLPRNLNRLKEKMKYILVSAGTMGVPHSTLIQKCRTKIYVSERLREVLGDWESRNLVQSFEVNMAHSKRPVKVWRATTLITLERL